MCFNCGLVGHAANLCRNPALEQDTLAPIGPWIRSTQYGKRKMEDKDRKFYSNPSHSPNFGKYSPKVPASLVSQLAAMKLQTQNQKEKNKSDVQPDQQKHTQDGGENTRQMGMQVTTEKGKSVPNMGAQQVVYQGTNNNGKFEADPTKQVKRLKLAYETSNANKDNMDIQILAGLEIQASQTQ
jgi:hypothetical protein